MYGKGFSLVEIVIGAAVLFLLVAAFGGAILQSQTLFAQSGDRARALLIAEEGIEAVRNIRDDDFTLLTDGLHGLTSGGTPASTGLFQCVDAVNEDDVYANWNFTLRACGSNDLRASVNTPATRSDYLRATNFGLSIPDGAAISGIEVQIERRASANNCIYDNEVRLIKNGVIVGNNKAVVPYWPTADGTASYGFVNDLWGQTWTETDIESSSFGVALAVSSKTSAPACISSGQVDNISIAVTYTPPGVMWQFQGSSDTTGIFTRTVSIASSDADTKHVTTTVSWMQNSFIPGKVELVADYKNWQALGVGDWAVPSSESTLNIGDTVAPNKIQTRGTLAYVVRPSGNPRFIVIDVANPLLPAQIGSMAGDAPNGPYSIINNIHLNGDYAYLTSADNARELQIIDISNPAAPVLVSSTDVPGNQDAFDVAVSGNYAYITKNQDGGNPEFFVYNISNPAAPVSVGSYNFAGNLREVVILGTHAYIATSSDTAEVLALNVGNPVPIFASQLNLTGSNDVLTIAGFNTTLVMGRVAGDLVLVEITSPGVMALRSTLLAGVYTGNINDISIGVENKYAFIGSAASFGRLRVVNICNILSPFLVGVASINNTVNGVAYNPQKDRALSVTTNVLNEFQVIKPQ